VALRAHVDLTEGHLRLDAERFGVLPQPRLKLRIRGRGLGERLAEELPDRVHWSGVYQMGVVYARSWMLAGTSVGSFTPKTFAS